MVLADKGSENARNGRRSRGPSPNGHVVAESTSEDESVPVDKIRVGRDYQAVCPPLQPIETRRPDTLQDRALLVWSPTIDIPETKLDEYITLAKEKYGYNGEQALGMLFWHKHDLERAVLDLANFTPFPDEWSVEDKVLFEQAFQFHGKSFHRIRQMLPDKSIASLVKYYYSWKKTRTRTSLMDKQARKLTTQRDGTTIVGGVVVSGGGGGGANTGGVIDISATSDGNTSDNGGVGTGGGGGSASADESDTDEKNEAGGTCGNCGVSCSLTHHSTKGQQLCHSCYQHWRRTGTARPTSGPGTHTSGRRGGVGNIQRHKRRPPRGMYINHDDLVAMAASPHGQLMLRAMDREIISLKRQVQHNKQIISTLKKKTSDGIQDLQPNIQQHLNIINNTTNISAQQLTLQTQINAKWTQDELLLAVQGVRKYGKDFKTIADVIGTKNEAHLKSFFTNYRKRYHLDDIIKDYELEHGVIQPISSNTENTEITTKNNDTNDNKMDIDSNHINNTGNNNDDNEKKVEIMDIVTATSTTITDSTMNGVSVDTKNMQSKSISIQSK